MRENNVRQCGSCVEWGHAGGDLRTLSADMRSLEITARISI